MHGWRNLRINGARLRRDIESLSRIGRDGTGALTRRAFSPGYQAARTWLQQTLSKSSINSREDAAGNTFGRVGPTDRPCVMSGSHLDTVPDGGSLDGAYGVVAAVEVARVLSESAEELPMAFECAAFVDEEGCFFDCLGSKALCGDVTSAELKTIRDPEGRLLTEAMQTAGLNPDNIESARRFASEIAAFVELHIEQGPFLDEKGIDIGNVEAIVGTSNTWFTFSGEPNHSGTTPMDMRRDAFLGAAEFASRARELVLAEGTPGRSRITFGLVEIETRAVNVIPGRCRIHQEIRDVSDKSVKTLTNKLQRLAEEVAKRHRLSIDVEPQPSNRAAVMARSVRATIARATKVLTLTTCDMPSGAAHDAQHLARLVPTGMIFVPSSGGRSHRRDEHTDWVALENGANVLLQTILILMHENSATARQR